MFKNLRTGTKLILLCAMFIISVGVTTYSLVVENQIAISFARKELVGSRFLAALRNIEVTLLRGKPFDPLATESGSPTAKMLGALAAAQSDAAPALQTGEFVQALSSALRRLGPSSTTDATAMDALVKTQQLAMRIGDDSNLTLDTDLDSYYMQNILVDQIPRLLDLVGELRLATPENADTPASSNENKAHILVVDGLIGSSVSETKDDLAAAYRGDADGSLKEAVDSTYASLFSAIDAYLATSKAGASDAGAAVSVVGGGNAAGVGNGSQTRLYEAVVNSADNAWLESQPQLDRLLRSRIERLLARMRLSLALTGALVGLSIIVAIMTYRHIVRPLEHLEQVASTVRETKNYDLRVADNSTNEIGKLSSAFDEMLAELAAARDRERAEQSEIARIARLTTMGAMTASIAHEVNQPLTAIVANGRAAQRWLANATPNLIEVNGALSKIVDDGRRAGQVIDSVRTMFKKGGVDTDRIDVNELIENILAIARGQIQKECVSVRTDLRSDIPCVLAGRTQLQQVLMNLTMNAVEAMQSIANRERLLAIDTAVHDPASVLITVGDSGVGIDSQNLDRIFDAFFTTKPDGMGMGLSICRSIIEGYGGRIWATRGDSCGSVFHVILPSASS
jgi:signal transduction histidine kinase